MTRKSTATKKDSDAPLSKMKVFFKSSATHYITGLIILGLAVYAGISMLSFFFTGAADQSKVEGLSLFQSGTIDGIENWTGMRGAILSNILMNEWFGISTFFLLAFALFVALRLMKSPQFHLLRKFIICALLTIWSSVALAFFLGRFFKESTLYIGGKHGFVISDLLVNNFGIPGTLLIVVLVFIIIMTLITSQTIPFLIRSTARKKKEWNWWKKKNEKNEENEGNEKNEKNEGNEKNEKNERNEKNEDNKRNIDNNKETSILPVKDAGFTINVPKGEEEEVSPFVLPEIPEISPLPFLPKTGNEDEEDENLLSELGEYDPTLDLSHYHYPTIDLLKEYNSSEMQVNMEEQNANKNKILSTLESFGIKIATIKATVGPTITLYEIQPEAGIRIAKIKNLEDDIALNLAALGIRIIAPIPGKDTIGIEVPNREPQTVSMRSVIVSKRFQEAKYELPIALGKTITNETFVFDLCKMPHLLVAGATGQGKSVGLNAIITSLLYKKHPSQLKFVLIDPKKVEFNIYSDIEKHFLAKLPDEEEPVITDVSKVVQTLNALTKEMDDRYNLLKKAHVRNIKEYNEKFIKRRLNPEKGHRFMPYFVVIIDEFGDLIMTAGKEVELPIARIAQLARAVGIHMIIATQRPSVSIITGIIKANFPARIAFRVSAMVDSRTILDTSGANQLVGKGDLLFSQGSDLTRVQCAFVDTPEVEKIAKFIGNQQGYPTAFELPEFVGEESSDKPGAVDLSDRDPLFEETARLIVIHQQGSTSLIQRKFEVGYNRAGRLMDQLEAAGIVGPARGSKPREVYIIDEYHLEQILNNLKQ
ncbi:MAG: DNA translocase FtsK [Candidatus Symbiothrix sp.]|jgi:S-DNA-T family DNA segregation ATPase FtsK/SpoIIIE|nr:DNA translocase FtsK [Candidatus Symbiothrix sp.]